jgi:CubicO group peptidase (beta-lactamase class C family)
MLRCLSRIQRSVVALSLLLFVVSPSLPALVTVAKPEEVGLSSERLDRIRELIDRQIEQGLVTGAVALVARRGRVAYLESRGMSDVEAKKPMAPDTLFRIASMSKPVTAVAILMLMEEGRLRLTDPVSRFIPEFRGLTVAVANESSNGGKPNTSFYTVPASREITIKDLLTHTSGVVSGGISDTEAARIAKEMSVSNLTPRPTESLKEYIPRISSVPLAFQPGSRWAYSPLAGFDTLGRIVEVASGQTFERFLKNRVFDPLEMKDTAFALPADRMERLATIYERTPSGLRRYGLQDALRSSVYFSGAGGLVSTAEDYFQFAQMLLNRGQGNGQRLLSPTTVDLMSGEHVSDSLPGTSGRGWGFGLGVQVVRDALPLGFRISNGSFGWVGTYCTFFWVDPQEKLVLVYLSQAWPFGQQPSRDFENAVMQAIVE